MPPLEQTRRVLDASAAGAFDAYRFAVGEVEQAHGPTLDTR